MAITKATDKIVGDSNGNLNLSGIVTASSFIGSGSGLTGVASTDNIKTSTTANFTGGIQVGGATTLGFNDDTEVYIGSPNGLKISHVSSSTTNEFLATNGSIHFYAGAAIELRKGYSGSYETMLKANPDGAVELYCDNSKRAETFGSGFKVSTGGELYIDGNAAGGHCQLIMTRSDMSYMIANETYLRFYRAGGNSSSPNTLTAEFTNSGHFRPGANNTYDLGDSSTRWRNIYTNDLNLSNEGSTNIVDNTWGNYTIQEGESDLFLINNRNGKKYKFNLTEVN